MQVDIVERRGSPGLCGEVLADPFGENVHENPLVHLVPTCRIQAKRLRA